MDSFDKQPYEEFVIASGFNKKGKTFSVGEAIVDQEIIVVDKYSEDVTYDVIVENSASNDNASKVYVKVKGGDVDSSPYKITFRCVTSLGNKFENDVKMKVVER